MSYSRFFSQRSLRRQPSAIRAIFPLTQLPGMLSLAGGLPHPESFPLEKMSLTLKGGTQVDISSQDLKAALQYSSSYGLESLQAELRAWMCATHGIDTTQDWKVCVGSGSQDVLSKAFDMVLSEGTPLLCEPAVYSGSLAALQAIAPKLCPVAADGEGITAQGLRDSIEKSGAKVLYLTPTGQNPTGTTLSNQRKREIYEVCCEKDVLILEDDPYYFVYYGEEKQRKSFFSMDREKRVLRFDSFSKILSAGMRVGWVSGPPELVDRIQLDMQSQSLHASGLSQIVALAVLRNLGPEGMEKHIQKVVDLYRARRDAFVGCCDKELRGLAEYQTPQAGMFLWLKLLRGITDTNSLVLEKGREAKVLFVPGKAFNPLGGTSPYVRASFSTIKVEDMPEAVSRLRRLIEGSAVSML